MGRERRICKEGLVGKGEVGGCVCVVVFDNGIMF